jgi:hypothetical protein
LQFDFKKKKERKDVSIGKFHLLQRMTIGVNFETGTIEARKMNQTVSILSSRLERRTPISIDQID